MFHPPAGADAAPARCGAPVVEGRACTTPTPDHSDQTFIKRVVAVGGDTVAVRDGLVVPTAARSRRRSRRRAPAATACDMTRPITVPKGSVFLMGDNRGNSDDSRFWGPVPGDWVIGKAFATYWPPDRVGGL